METIIYVLSGLILVFVALGIWAFKKAVKFESMYCKAEAGRIVLETANDSQAKELYKWQHLNQEIVVKDNAEAEWLSLPYPIIHRELMELRPKFIIRRVNEAWRYELIGAAVCVKIISNTEQDGYRESWAINNEISIEEYQQQLKLKP